MAPNTRFLRSSGQGSVVRLFGPVGKFVPVSMTMALIFAYRVTRRKPYLSKQKDSAGLVESLNIRCACSDLYLLRRSIASRARDNIR